MKFRTTWISIGLLGLPAVVWATTADTETQPAANSPVQVVTPSSGTPDPFFSLASTSASVNEFTGQAAFAIPLGSMSNHGGISHAVSLQYYGGGLEHSHPRKKEWNPTSWVGEGFSLKAPYILADTRGTVAVEDDSYTLSLDGNSQLELIAETSSPTSLYPKLRPQIHVTRAGASLFHPWIVKMPDGTEYHFATSSTADGCTGTSNVLCLPVVGNSFHSVPQTTKAPVLWYVTSILSRDGASRINFGYEKITNEVFNSAQNADRAVYLKNISTSAPDGSGNVLNEIQFQREPRFDFVDNSFRNPLVQFETERLAVVTLKNRGDPTRVFHLKYQPGIGRTRLTEIREAVGEHERFYYRCEYDPVNPWRIKKVSGPSGVAWEYGYTATPVEAVRQDIGIGAQALGQIGFTGEFNEKYYVQVATVPNGYGNSSHLKLYEFEQRGSYWKLIRTYTGGSAFSMAPDGSYFAVASLIAGASYTLRLFNPLASGLEGVSTIDFDNPSTYPANFKIADPNVWLQSEFALMPTGTPVPSGGPQIFTFSDWLAIYKPGYGVVRFFKKTAPNTWAYACPEYGTAPKTDPYVFPPSASRQGPGALGFQLEPPNGNNPCWSWKKMVRFDGATYNNVTDTRLLEVRQGENFVAVIFRNVGAVPSEVVDQQWTMGGAVRIFAKRGNEIEWVDPGNTTSFGYGTFDRDKSNLQASSFPTWGSRDSRWATQRFPISLDVSVHGDLVGILVRANLGYQGIHTANICLHVFSVDLEQNLLKTVYTRGIQNDEHFVNYGSLDNRWSTNDSHIFMGRNFLVHKRRREQEKSPYFRLEVYHFNRVSGQTDMVRLPDNLETRFQTAVKIMGDYFFVETMSPSDGVKEIDQDLLQAYRHVVSGATYPATGPGKLYRVGPGYGTSPLKVEDVTIPGLNQLTIQEDRFLGYNNAVGAKHYIYGRMNELGIVSGTINSVSGLSVLSTSGVLEFMPSATAELRFHDDFKGSLSPTSLSAVGQVKISTKGSSSNSGDGSEQTILFDVTEDTPHFNAKGKVLNIRKAKRVLSGPSSEMVTEYISDFQGSELLGAAQTLHGMPVKVTARPGSAVGRQPGEKETRDEYFVSELANSPDGQPLRKPAHAVRLRKRVEKTFFFNGQQTTETRNTAFDVRNGIPRITIVKTGGEYRVRATRFEHEIAEANQLTAPPSNVLVRQSANYLFRPATDICAGAGQDPCAGVDFAWLTAAAQRGRAVSSQVSTYNADGEVQEVFTWRKKDDATGLHTLSGVTTIPPAETEATAGRWVKEMEVLARAEDIPAAVSKHNGPVATDRRGVRTTTFYGGVDGLPLAVAENASKVVCSFFGAEEEITGAGFGAFGDWEPTGSISTDMAHSGERSVKSEGAFGPTINIHFKQDAEFWARKKGILVSGWMFVPGTANGNPSNDPKPAAAIEFRESSGMAPIRVLNLLTEYASAYGPFPYNRWVKLERLVTWEELAVVAGSDPVLRIWFGKEETPPAQGDQNALPVYVDDVRIHPSDATMTSRSYNARGQETAILDGSNMPVFPEYNVWDQAIGTKDDRGKFFSVSASKRVGED